MDVNDVVVSALLVAVEAARDGLVLCDVDDIRAGDGAFVEVSSDADVGGGGGVVPRNTKRTASAPTYVPVSLSMTLLLMSTPTRFAAKTH